MSYLLLIKREMFDLPSANYLNHEIIFLCVSPSASSSMLTIPPKIIKKTFSGFLVSMN